MVAGSVLGRSGVAEAKVIDQALVELPARNAVMMAQVPAPSGQGVWGRTGEEDALRF